ncbi:polysaccharide deacetylase family protein [Candidatus Thioglobus sp.]|jgi:peptidoglycan/xylan/chitin deacetylase (PgdA/CDA1 family)|nr:polysaccharide deacetylase family protein [Candidatus Thioglobus sp.]
MQQKPIPILMYHSIAAMPKGTVMRSLHVPPTLFKLQMWLLKIMGYQGLSMGELQPYLMGEKIGKVVGITFDDGFKNNFTKALPILRKNGFSATCYIISQNIGGINHWDLDKGIDENPLMNENEIKQWLDNGMEIGSHTQNHVHLAESSIEIATKEIIQSKLDLEKRFNCQITHFCYPYGSYNNEIINIAKNANYQTATTVNRSRIHRGDNLLALSRIPITHRTFPHLFLMKILSKYEDRHA